MAVVTAFPLCATDVVFLKKWQDCLFGDEAYLRNFLLWGKSGEGNMWLAQHYHFSLKLCYN